MKSHLRLFVRVFIVHIVYAVHSVYVESAKPGQIAVKARLYLGIVKHLVVHNALLRSKTRAEHIVHTAVEREQEQLCEVGSRAEELHLLADLHSRDTAGDRVVVSVGDTHKIVVFVLYRVCIDRKLCAKALESLGQMNAPEHREVGLGRFSESIERVENSERGLGYERAMVLTHTANALGDPHRVSAEELVVFGRTKVSCRAELDNEIVDDLLRANLVKKSCLHIALEVDIKEGRAATEGHSRAVLLLICREIAEVGPLHRLARVGCGLADIKTVKLSHFLELLEEVDLAVELLKQLYVLCVHYSLADFSFVCRLLLDKSIYAVKRDAAVVTYNSSSAVRIGKAREQTAMSCRLHLVGVNAENSVVMSSSVGKIFLYLVRELISVGLTRVARHTNAAKGVNSSLERLVGLKSDDYLVFLVNVSCRIVAERGHRACVDRENSASLALKLLQLAQSFVQRFGTLGSTLEEACVLGVRRIVFVDKVADVDVLTPISRHKILPRIKFHHSSLTFLCNCCLRYGCSDKKTKHPRYFGAAQTVGYSRREL